MENKESKTDFDNDEVDEMVCNECWMISTMKTTTTVQAATTSVLKIYPLNLKKGRNIWTEDSLNNTNY